MTPVPGVAVSSVVYQYLALDRSGSVLHLESKHNHCPSPFNTGAESLTETDK